ncbi:MAG TPA: homogentisate 1,2-dioxygenase [Bacteroidales bacterium]|nr:homogentisate 1,2-dioxygenase [Bacteroidales bacterium]HPI86087.1 homogentisate 1,2-dioxygenase [Bacteroidales bacterium]HPM93059.1 homogentisate 1,2-dioxygenase [Bacteroidales bacterium]
MPHYQRLGLIPPKRHIQFRKPDGALYSEQLVSTEGFSAEYSLVYHVYPPTVVTKIDKPFSVAPEIAVDKNMQHRSFQGFKVAPQDNYINSRIPVLVNDDCYIHLAAPKSWAGQQSTRTMENGQSTIDNLIFFKNSDAHELIFIHQGEGTLKTMYGSIPFRYGDHLIIPRGVIYRLDFNSEENRLFIVESFSPFRFPKRYVNRMGQLLEHAPFYERDIRKPENLETHDAKGDFIVMVKKQDLVYPYHYASHPFDVIGWDGYHFPYALSIHDFEPITGRIHQPPPVHQTFEANNFVMCAFVPRLYDYHPEAIPVPYNHSNVDSDEVLYYVDGEFMSRKHVEKGQITLHPIGIPHGPHPGTVEKSLGQKETRELAVMVDTFRPLKITKQAMEIEDSEYFRSWAE